MMWFDFNEMIDDITDIKWYNMIGYDMIDMIWYEWNDTSFGEFKFLEMSL